MNDNQKRPLLAGCLLLVAFFAWTILVQRIDVQPIGPNASAVGFAHFNRSFHKWTGVHMQIYVVTDWLGLVPIMVCTLFAGIGLVQLIRRKSIFKVDYDLFLLGAYYAAVMAAYLIFEKFPVNYRPVLIDGYLEASYPSSTTLLVLCVMPALVFQVRNRVKNASLQKLICIPAMSFSVFMLIGRTISGVHWFTDIIGAVLLSAGLFSIYKALVLLMYNK